MKDINEIVQKVKELFHDLGRVPLRLELESGGVSRHFVSKYGYNEIIALAGFEPLSKLDSVNARKPKLTNEIFERSIDKHIEEYVPRTPVKENKFSKILCWPDSHYPFVNKEAEEKMIQFAIENQPDYIIQVIGRAHV